MSAATICSDFGAQENKVHCFPLYLPWGGDRTTTLQRLDLSLMPDGMQSSTAAFRANLRFLFLIKLDIHLPCVCACSVAQRCQFFATPRTVAHQAPLSMEYSRQEYWRKLPLPTPRGLTDPGIKSTSPMSPTFWQRIPTTEPPSDPTLIYSSNNMGAYETHFVE